MLNFSWITLEKVFNAQGEAEILPKINFFVWQARLQTHFKKARKNFPFKNRSAISLQCTGYAAWT